MADVSDVSNALVTLIAATIYPSGTAQASVAGVGVRVYAGWPNPEQLDTDLRAATPICHVSVFTRPEERNTTRFTTDWKPVSVNTPTMTLTISGQTVTVGGVVPPANNPHNAMLFANGKPYVYAVLATDTLTTIAASLAALIVIDMAGTSAVGAVITMPNSARINGARVGVTGSSMRELRRQERSFQISIWADTFVHRDAIAQAIDTVLAFTTFLTLADSSAGRLIYKGSAVSDDQQKDRLFRRDLTYMVEYATTQTETETQITQEQLNVSAAIAGALPYQLVSTNYS